ncbi:MAG: hypothetical protein IE885_07445 [Campylobacterales bacterium]|nr:hypothetical protein [Campylobacterales bacterium]
MIFSFGCNNNVNEKTSYLQKIEIENNISYDQILNTRGSYITSMCYTMTQDESLESVSNPCYSCHTKGIIPNYYNDSPLQESYNFPPEMMKNPFSNLFKDRSIRVSQISDEEIWTYVRQSNYIDEKGNILLADRLPKDWEGYIPDCYFNFDSEGFDRDINGNYTLWRAFRYYPFLGTFWPTNGSMDDVLIRLDQNFAMSEDGQLDIEVYKLNLAIVESVVKQKDINLSVTVDEVQYGVDLNQNGILDSSSIVVVATYDQMSYVGMAKKLLEEKKIHLALGLYPENTEFLHSVRYIDWDENLGRIVLSKRMKELRYAKKYEWNSYSAIARTALTETKEAIVNGTDEAVLATFRGDYEYGLNNEIGWIYQGFIEDKNGLLRPQTHEETINCMGCHSHLGSTTDSTFAFARKFEGIDPDANDYGWNHWTQKGLKGIKEPLISYFNYGEQYEYSFYLQNNHSGNEFRNNQEVQEKFFHSDGSVKQDMLEALHQDISLLLFPSKERALELNKGYKTLVEEQSFIYGRDANVLPMENVYTKIQAEQSTQIEQVIVR